MPSLVLLCVHVYVCTVWSVVCVLCVLDKCHIIMNAASGKKLSS